MPKIRTLFEDSAEDLTEIKKALIVLAQQIKEGSAPGVFLHNCPFACSLYSSCSHLIGQYEIFT